MLNTSGGGGAQSQLVPYDNAILSTAGWPAHPSRAFSTRAMSAKRSRTTCLPVGSTVNIPAQCLSQLSAPQLEAVANAVHTTGQAQDGKTRGYLLADGTGMGKGRQCLAFALHMIYQECKFVLYVSKSQQLFEDLMRDVRDMNVVKKVNIVKLHACSDLTAIKTPTIAFATYGELIQGPSRTSGASSSHSSPVEANADDADYYDEDDDDDESPSQSPASRLDAFKLEGSHAHTAVKCLASLNALHSSETMASGCIIFDECHVAKGGERLGMRRGSKSGAGTITGRMVVWLQEQVPMARVLYASATCASSLSDFGYLVRLDLFKGCGETEPILRAAKKMGDGACELFCTRLVGMGQCCARVMSMQDVTYVVDQMKLNSAYRNVYRDMCTVWEHIMKGSLKSIKELRGQRLSSFKHLLLVFKVPHIIKRVKREVQAGNSVVIGLFTTGEAALKRSSPEEAISLIRDCMGQAVADVRYNDNALAKTWERLEESLTGLKEHVIDELVEGLGGADSVAEISGRKNQLCRSAEGHWVKHARTKNNIMETLAFQRGEKHIAIITEAASTGISLHADPTSCKKPRQRIHLICDLTYSADKQLQQMGRTHRSGQRIAPRYVLITTDLPGEMRFIAALEQKMAKLGASTVGDRRAHGILSGCGRDAPVGIDLLTTRLGAQVLCQLLGEGAQALRRRQAAVAGTANSTDPDPDLEKFHQTFWQNNQQRLMGVHRGLTQMRKEFKGCSPDTPRLQSRFMNAMLSMPMQVQQDVFNMLMVKLEEEKEAELSLNKFVMTSLHNFQVQKRVLVEPTVKDADLTSLQGDVILVKFSASRGMLYKQALDAAIEFVHLRRETHKKQGYEGSIMLMSKGPIVSAKASCDQLWMCVMDGVPSNKDDRGSGRIIAIFRPDQSQPSWDHLRPLSWLQNNGRAPKIMITLKQQRGEKLMYSLPVEDSGADVESVLKAYKRAWNACATDAESYTFHMLTGDLVPHLSLIESGMDKGDLGDIQHVVTNQDESFVGVVVSDPQALPAYFKEVGSLETEELPYVRLLTQMGFIGPPSVDPNMLKDGFATIADVSIEASRMRGSKRDARKAEMALSRVFD